MTTTILTTANKLSRLGQLTLGGSSLACLGFERAVFLCQEFKFSGKVFVDVEINTAMNALQDYAEGKEGTLIYGFKGDKGQMIRIDLFNFGEGEVASLLNQLDEKSKQVLVNDIKIIADWKSDPQGPKNGKIFCSVENGILKVEHPRIAHIEFVTTAVSP
ncbi:MAG: hypothetical protein JSR80_03035 [Verrucomicrobia bacterium]|nr:hypothetical protein [Verrucomicrobiota bacterium]